MTNRIHKRVFLAILLAVVTIASGAWALSPDANGWYFTGSGVRTKSVAFISVKVYSIRHDMKQLPPAKSKRAVIDADVDKKITFKMLRDVDAEKIQNAFKEGFQKNGYGDQGKIGQFVGAIRGELKENAVVTIAYDATAKTTTISTTNGGSATIPSVEFMKAAWSLWFGNIDQPALGDQMIANLP